MAVIIDGEWNDLFKSLTLFFKSLTLLMMLHFLSLSSCSVLWTLLWMPRRWCFVVLMLPSFSCYTTFLPWFKWLNLPPSTSFVLHFPFLEKEKSLHVISSTREFNFQAKNQRRGNDHSLDHLVFVLDRLRHSRRWKYSKFQSSLHSISHDNQYCTLTLESQLDCSFDWI